mgnify:CR=1 FL=1|tara:strand:+ start:303 stop:1997 length:1695 start_codon:yes stop_codon:yes gene_type:complete
MKIEYIKNENKKLFSDFTNKEYLNLSEIQNYTPIYRSFFDLTNKNYKNVNFKTKYNITSIHKKIDYNKYTCNITNSVNNNHEKKDVYFKYAHLVDPVKYMMGKYKDIPVEQFFKLPFISEDNNNNCLDKYNLINNSAYIDGLFSYITSTTIQDGFIHANEFYGMYLGIKNDYVVDVSDDLEYLLQSQYFHNNKNILFTLETNDRIFIDKSFKYKKPLKIANNNDELTVEINDYPDEIFETIFKTDNIVSPVQHLDLSHCAINKNVIYENNNIQSDDDTTSTCSSSSSITNNEEIKSEYSDSDTENSDYSDESDESELEESITIIKKYPTLIISTQCSENTLDEYMNNTEISTNEWKSILFQIIVILTNYQKKFDFTHNDLHSSNIVYDFTEKQNIYYKIDGASYKVPTFGKIYKIIDFGRAIFKINNIRYCSDCFNKGEDADSQYNCEPFITEDKPIIEPNSSFDLCRFGCSMYDHFIDDIDEEDQVCKKNPIANLIRKWCLDDNNKNILYKKSGEERYPEFKLYKMIARNVHNHIPSEEIKNKLFESFKVNSKTLKKVKVVHI